MSPNPEVLVVSHSLWCCAEHSGTQEGWGARCCLLMAGVVPAHGCLRPIVETFHLAFGFGAPVPQPSSLSALPNSSHKLFRF